MLQVRALAGSVKLNGQLFEWELIREPQWCSGDGWKGMSIVLRRKDTQRTAILEFPMPSDRRSKLQPQLRRPQVTPRIVENGVRTALAGGWDPVSRGRPVLFEVDANGRQKPEAETSSV
jgi:hypothetical protein